MLTLIDSGAHGSMRRILRALVRDGRKPEDVRQILLTHSHGDHSGEAKAFRERWGTRIVAGAADVPVLEGREPYVGPRTWWGKLGYGWLRRFPRFSPDVAAEGRTEVGGGLVLLPAPGHTPGHMVVYAPDHRALFLGDAVLNIGQLRASWPTFTWDPVRNLESIRELSDVPAEALFLGHGGPIRRDGQARLRALVR